jgi:hypothetical protein
MPQHLTRSRIRQVGSRELAFLHGEPIGDFDPVPMPNTGPFGETYGGEAQFVESITRDELARMRAEELPDRQQERWAAACWWAIGAGYLGMFWCGWLVVKWWRG